VDALLQNKDLLSPDTATLFTAALRNDQNMTEHVHMTETSNINEDAGLTVFLAVRSLRAISRFRCRLEEEAMALLLLQYSGVSR
jgi:hypothetical protein